MATPNMAVTATLQTVINGRADVPGPLCNIYIDRAGGIHLIAAGKANHAGRNSSIALNEMRAGAVTAATRTAMQRNLLDDTVGNGSTIGIEIENNGVGELWSDAPLAPAQP